MASWSTSFAGNCNVGGIVGATFTNTPINCINYGNISSYCNNNNVGSGYAGGIAGFNGYKDYGNLENNYNYGKAIISQGLNGDKLKKGGAGRIAGYSIKTNSCYSINSTTVNGSIPTENIAPNAINGGSLTKKEMDEKVKDLV